MRLVGMGFAWKSFSIITFGIFCLEIHSQVEMMCILFFNVSIYNLVKTILKNNNKQLRYNTTYIYMKINLLHKYYIMCGRKLRFIVVGVFVSLLVDRWNHS